MAGPAHGEGFNWGYFLAPAPNGAVSDPPSVFTRGYYPVPTSPVIWFKFDAGSPLMFNDYDNYFAQFFVYSYDYPYVGVFSMFPTTNYYRDKFLGVGVTFDNGSALSITADAFTSGGQEFSAGSVSPPTYIAAVGGMSAVT
jgi:hypothetical protein